MSGLATLLAALRPHFEAGRDRADAVGAEIRRVLAALDHVGDTPGAVTATNHPLLRHLPGALALADASAPATAAALRQEGEALPWRYGYTARPDAPGLEASMGWAEIVGPEAPYRSDEACFGLTLIGPHTHYLEHAHPAVELYHVLAGTAVWTGTPQAPGSFILHPSNFIHAMRTENEPLLALYSWTGDVVSPSVWAGAGLPARGA